MIDDRVSLPPSVYLTETGLVDEVVGQAYPVNGVARQFLERLQEGPWSLTALTQDIANRYRVAPEQIRLDLEAFAHQLNRNWLLNRQPLSLWNEFFSLLSPRYQATQEVWHRFPMGQPWPQTIRSLAIGSWLARRPFLVFLFPFSMAGFLSPSLMGALPGILVGLWLSAVLHELGHVLAVTCLGGKAPLMFLGVALFRLAVVRRRLAPGAEILVGLAGPLTPSLVGFALVVVGKWVQSGFLVGLSLPLVLNILGFLTMNEDMKPLFAWLTNDAREENG